MKIPRMFSGLLIFIGVDTIITGYLLVIFVGKPEVDSAKASENWPTTEGIVKTSEVTKKHDDDGDIMYSVNVLYNYTVKDQNMDGNRVWFGGDYRSSNREEFQRTVNDYPVGKKVKVYYNPDDPVVSVLVPGAFKSTYVFFVIGWVITGIGGIITIVSTVLLIFFGKKKEEKVTDQPLDQTYDGTSLENSYGPEND